MPLFLAVFLTGVAGGTAPVFDISELMTTSVNSVQTQLFTVLNIVIPATVSVLVAVVIAKFGLKWLKRITA